MLSAALLPPVTCPATLSGTGWGARASAGLGQLGSSSSLRTTTRLGGNAVLQVKEWEQGSSWADFKGSRGRQPGGPGHGWWGRVWTKESDTPELHFGAATCYPCGLGQVI